MTPTPIPIPGGVSLQAYYKVGNPGTPNDNSIRPQFEIFNAGKTSIALSDVTVRYWYIVDRQQSQSYWCDYATIGCSNITGQFVPLSPARSSADTYLEIAFTNGAGCLAPGASTG